MRKMIVAVLIVLLFAVACSDLQSKASTKDPDPEHLQDRFGNADTYNMYILTDKTTGCKYLCKGAYGITPLLRSDGKPDCAETQ